MGANHSGHVCPPNPYCPLSRLESSKVKITEASFYCCLMVSCSRPSQGSYKSESCSYLGFPGSGVPQDRPPPGWMWISIRPIWLTRAEVIRLRSSCSQALRTSSDPLPHPCRHPHPHPAETGNVVITAHLPRAASSGLPLAPYPRLPLFKFKACVNIPKTDLGWLNLFCSSQHDHIAG